MCRYECYGNGFCYEQIGFNKYHKEYDCKFNCKILECKNHIICGIKAPKWYFERYNGNCNYCNSIKTDYNKLKKYLKEKDYKIVSNTYCCCCMNDNVRSFYIKQEKYYCCVNCFIEIFNYYVLKNNY